MIDTTRMYDDREQLLALRLLFMAGLELLARDGLDAEARARNLATASCLTEQEFASALRRAGFDRATIELRAAHVRDCL